jgi:prepilin peptidase CpaA
LIAALSDLKSYTIPNWLSLAIVALFILHVIAAPPPLADLGVRLAIAGVIFAVSALLFAKGIWGGGDAKLLSSLVLWVGLLDLPRLLLTMSLAGGLLAIILILVRARQRHLGLATDRRIPYGIAIAVAGIEFCLRQSQILS